MDPPGLADKLAERARDRRAALRLHNFLSLGFVGAGCGVLYWLFGAIDKGPPGFSHLFAMAMLVAYWVFIMEHLNRRLMPRIRRPVVVCHVCGTVMKGRRVDALLKENGCGVAMTGENVV